MTGRYTIRLGTQSNVIFWDTPWGVPLNETFLPQRDVFELCEVGHEFDALQMDSVDVDDLLHRPGRDDGRQRPRGTPAPGRGLTGR